MTSTPDTPPLSPGCVLSVEDAILNLPGPPDEVHAWLKRQGLIIEFVGSSVVIWGDVLSALRVKGKPRRVIPPGSIVSEDRAARALPWRRASAVAWLRDEGLSVVADGRRVVVWDAVADRLRATRRAAVELRQRLGPMPPLLGTPGRILD